MKKVVVCSMNKAKNNAVSRVLKDFIADYMILSLETNSLVSETPMSDDEGILGCMNRIRDAREQISDGDLYIAMEGILTQSSNEFFLCGWTIIYDRESDSYLYGCSSKIHIPYPIMQDFNPDVRLSTIVADYMGCTDEEVSVIGTNGILTHGCYTREDEFSDSILCAISSKYERLHSS